MKKVAVIGCSVAGLSAANELVDDRSFKVTVYDKKSRVGGDVICGGALSSFMLREIGLDLPRNSIASEITSVRIYAPNGDYWELESEGDVYGYVLWRDVFERELAKQASSKGAEIILDHEVTDLNLDADYIVGADGLTGTTRKLAGFPDLDDVHIGVQRTAYIPNHPENRIELHFGREVAPCGYSWIFPDGEKGRVRIGLGIPLSIKRNPVELLDRFMHTREAEPTSQVKAKLIPTAKPLKRLIHGKVLLVGDAGRLCDPLTGGGIANAFLSGKYAAKAIRKGRAEKHDSYCLGLKRRNLRRYELKRILYELSDRDFNEMIGAMKGFKPKLTRISWAIIHALIWLAVKKPRLFTKHKVLRRLSKIAT